jgi:hypothetical protein
MNVYDIICKCYIQGDKKKQSVLDYEKFEDPNMVIRTVNRRMTDNNMTNEKHYT